MTFKQYNFYRILVVMTMAISISCAMTMENYYLPIFLMIIGMALMCYLRQRLRKTEVIADERDYKLAGDAARYTILVYGFIGAFTIFILMALSSGPDDSIYQLSHYLAFSICFLFLLNVLIFKIIALKK